ncbi:MAG: DUF3343 domain-containing protein [Oscillospiraceae bacterium]|nr:DUF3343 domain-containing protein [Oscillospiraceae bacterium]
MEPITLNVSSVTNAMRAQTLLRQNGIRTAVGRVSDPGGSSGCGYHITITGSIGLGQETPEQIQEKALRLLKAAEIKVRNGE